MDRTDGFYTKHDGFYTKNDESEQANALLEQKNAGLEKRLRNLAKSTKTPRQRLLSPSAAAEGRLGDRPMGRDSRDRPMGSMRAGSASRTVLSLSPPPSQLLNPAKTHAWAKMPPTGRESPLRGTRTSSNQSARLNSNGSGGGGGGSGEENCAPPPQPPPGLRQRLPVVSPAASLADAGLGETP